MGRLTSAAVVAAVAVAASGVGRPAAAQPVDPYRVAVFTPDSPPFYVDPRLDPDGIQTPELSYPRLVDEIEQIIAGDARFEWLGGEELVSAAVAGDRETQTRRFADDYRDRGIENFGRYELDSAIDELEQAVESYVDAQSYLTHPEQVAVAHEYLARAHIEQANRRPDEAVALRNAARAHFRQMIRLSPVSDIREGLFPSDVVGLYYETYLELLTNDGLTLGDERARGLARRHGLDRVVWAYFVKDKSGDGAIRVRMTFEVYEADGERVWSETFPVALSTDASVPLVNRAVSRYLACVPLRYQPPPPGPPGDAGRFFLQAGWGGGVYAERPVEGQFLNQGVGITLDYHLTDNFGLFGRANVMFGARDPQGDLLGGFTSTRLSGGLMLGARAAWFRPFLGLGLELNVVGGFTASDDFWCKVSGGAFESFGAGRDCRPSEVQEQEATVLLGPCLMPGFAIDIVGPFAVYVLGSFAFYISDARTNVDFPVGGEAGIEYRF